MAGKHCLRLCCSGIVFSWFVLDVFLSFRLSRSWFCRRVPTVRGENRAGQGFSNWKLSNLVLRFKRHWYWYNRVIMYSSLIAIHFSVINSLYSKCYLPKINWSSIFYYLLFLSKLHCHPKRKRSISILDNMELPQRVYFDHIYYVATRGNCSKPFLTVTASHSSIYDIVNMMTYSLW